MIRADATASSSSDSEAGFTLVELLVAMSVGLILMFALSSIMIVSMHQTQRTFTSVDATRQARTALAVVENELHSACVTGDAPVQVNSDASNLDFLSYTGSMANPAPVWHVLSYAHGTLTDSTYAAVYTTSGTGHSWTQGSTQLAKTTLLTDVAQQPGPLGPLPIFKYYQYQVAYTSGGNSYWYVPDGNNIEPGTTSSTPNSALDTTTPLSAANAATVVEVGINLNVGPSGENLARASLSSNFDPVTDAISLRLTTPPDYVPSGSGSGSYLPCQ